MEIFKSVNAFIRKLYQVLKNPKTYYCLALFCLFVAFGFTLESFKFNNQFKMKIYVNLNYNHDFAKETTPYEAKTYFTFSGYKTRFFVPIFTCKAKDPKPNLVCKLGKLAYCVSTEPAEVVDKLWVVAPIYSYNQPKLKLMYTLHENFENYVKSIGLSFCTIEGIRLDLKQSYLATHPGREPHEIQMIIYDETYMRENLINAALKKIKDWGYVAWIDAHQIFENTYWWEEAIVKAEKFSVIQLLRHSVRLSTRNETIRRKEGILSLSLIQNDLDLWKEYPEYGNGYILRRELYNKIGYIIDTCITSGCDLLYISSSLTPNMSFKMFSNRAPKIFAQFEELWINPTRKIFNGSRSFVRGDIIHFEHEHYFDYVGAPMLHEAAGFNVTAHLIRNQDFILRLTNSTIRQIMVDFKISYTYDN